MSCENNVCGTGDWNGPLPGDPDNNISLTARTVYGGVLVRWSYPAINGHAVAHTEVFRGATSDTATSILLDRAGGSSYLDRVSVDKDTEFYYWIEVVSIHGTRGARIGPVSGIAVPQIKQTLESLTGLIDAGLLAETLKTNISGITLNNQAIYQEIQDRLNSNQVLQAALAAVQGDLGEALTYINQEITQRADADSAIVTQVNVLAAGLNEAKAAIVEERTVRVTKDEALAQVTDTLYAEIGDANAAIVRERTARVTADEAIATDYEAMSTKIGLAEGAITEIKNLTLTPDSALATKLATLSTDVGNAAAAVEELDTALTSGTHALASSVKTVEAAINGDMATGQTGLIAEVNSITGQLDTMFFAKVEVNGLIGGFGVWNNGVEVQAGFDVDTFWIGRTNENKVKPFIVAGGKVYMDEAIIRTASIDTLMLKGEAVTVPLVSNVPGTNQKGKNEGVWTRVNEAYMPMDQAGIVYILHTSAQGFIQNQRYWSFQIRVNGAVVRSIMGRQPNDAPVLSASVPLNKGTHRVEIYWSAHPDVILGYSEIFMMGAKK